MRMLCGVVWCMCVYERARGSVYVRCGKYVYVSVCVCVCVCVYVCV